jgi:hypothetical protein
MSGRRRGEKRCGIGTRFITHMPIGTLTRAYYMCGNTTADASTRLRLTPSD